ncbi:MAG: hypothetical protein P4M07_21475 [Xanthobacteraceae bacterium]|nr:hypothetical protein [Xanthobacteraceae bacterium]
MLISETIARTKWCPMVRVDGDNRLHNTKTDGFENSDKMYHCIAGSCMAWRQYQLSYARGGAEPEHHGYCGLAGRPDHD